MKKKIPVSMLIGLMLLAAVAAFNVAYIVIWNTFNDRLTTLNAREAAFMKLSEVAAYVDEYYIADYSPDRVLDGAAEGYIDALPDKSSYYISADEVQHQETLEESERAGIGIIGCENRTQDGICVLDMYEGSTAAEFGIQRFDLITAVSGVPIAEMSYDEALDRIRGEEGTNVDLTVYRERADETFSVSVRRGAVVSKRTFDYDILSEQIGYIFIDNFDRGTDSMFLAALAELKERGMKSLVLDLRLNPGGYMDVMTNMADPLMGEGVIYSERHASGEVNYVHSMEDALNMPMAVLVSAYTVGPGEYLAAALQENGCARVFGQVTAGSGYAQSHIDLLDGSALVLDSAEYFTPLEQPLQGSGLVPDDEVTMTPEQWYGLFALGEGDDPQLQAAIEYLG